MIVAGTGHRPNKLGGYSEEAFVSLVFVAKLALSSLKPDKVITGMALGWDQALAKAAYELNIPFTAAVPFKEQQAVWPKASKLKYKQLLSYASEVVIVSEGEYETWKLHKRNEWMVDNSDLLLALFDVDNAATQHGVSKGGTHACVSYALKQRRPIYNAWNIFDKSARVPNLLYPENTSEGPTWLQEIEERLSRPS